jgi:glycine dehydrogenase
VAVAADILSLVKLTPPGEIGAAVVVGTTQRLESQWVTVGHTPLFCYKEEYKRSMPGRIIGVSQDAGIVCVWRYKHVNNISNVRKHLTFVLHRFYLCDGRNVCCVSRTKRLEIYADAHGMASTLADALNKLGVYQIPAFSIPSS